VWSRARRMNRLMGWAQGFALALGGPGLFVVAFLDASLLSLPEINDILIIWMVTKHPDRFVYYASMSTLGSIAGCFLLYWLARKGGEAFVRRRAGSGRLDRSAALFERYGVLAILVPAILPPPAPFKIFVLMAGVARMPVRSFATAIAVGRGIRYFGEGLLALWFGARAIEYTKQHGTEVALVAALVVLIAGATYFAWQARQSRRSSAV